MSIALKTDDIIFETSWEVCNKVGGIYTVLSTKAKTLTSLNKDRIVFIGPDIWTSENPSLFFKESKTLLKQWLKDAELPFGIKVRVGRWDIPGRPIVILVDYKSLFQQKDNLYAEMWENYKVDSLHAYGDYDESCMFGCASAMVIESYANYLKSQKKANRIIAHFDEWTTGMGLLYIKSHKPEIATVFTTHATSIGRSICGNNKPLYDYMEGYNGDQMADELNMQSKHSLEKTAAHVADAFTTVSDVTARECTQLIGRTPLVTPNGFEPNFVPTKTKYKACRKEAREKLFEVANALLGYDLPENTYFLATSGRNEFRNKGLDAFIDSMNILRSNWTDSERPIVAFILVPAWVKEPRKDLIESLQNKSYVENGNHILTHEINNYDCDSIWGKLNYLNLNNKKEDNVKVIYVPSYLNGDDGIFNMSYYNLLIGFDCTIFASYYEPWGYTPMESVAFGVPTITTDLAGFGQWALKQCGNGFAKSGVQVVHRTDSNYDEVIYAISDTVKEYLELDEKGREGVRAKATELSKLATWNYFMTYYKEAYVNALKSVDVK